MLAKFNIESQFDFELVLNIKRILGCSLATVYRTLGRAQMPLYFVPNHRSATLIHSASLWRIAATPAWRKYLKRIRYRMAAKRCLKKLLSQYGSSDVFVWYEGGLFEPLTLEEVVSAADNGLLPCDSAYNCPTWFYAILNGVFCLPLPQKPGYRC